MATIQTKWIDVGSYTVKSVSQYGFDNVSFNYGTISNSQNGSSNVNLDSVYSGADVELFAWFSASSQLSLQLSGTRANSGWATVSIGGVSFSRSAASHSQSGGSTTWSWSSVSSNPFGTTTGADKEIIWDDGASSTPTYSVTAPASINEGSAGTMNVSTTNVANSTTLYWTVEPSGDFGTSSGSFSISSNAGSFTVTPSADQTTEGAETGTIRIRTGSTSGTIVASDTFTINDTSTTPAGPGLGATVSTYTSNPTRYNNNGSTYTTATTTVVATSAYTHGLGNCASNTIYWASYTSGASGDTATYSTISPIGRTYTTATSRTLAGMGSSSASIALPSSYGGSRVYIWAVLVGTTITSSTTMTCTGANYYIEYPDDGISLSPSATTLSSSSTSNVTVNVTGDTSGTQYRLYTNNISRWVSTYNGGGSSTTDFTISYDEASTGQPGTGFTELPGNGQTYTYFSQCRVTAGVNDNANSGGGALWINTGNSFTVSRSAAGTYSVSASPTSINEGQSTTWTVTTTNVANNTTVNYTITGIVADDLSSGSLTGTLTISSNTASTSITLANDNLTDGSETATLTLASTDSTGASTGTPSASVTIADTSTAGSGGSGDDLQSGLSAGTYGLQILNSSNNIIIDDVSRLGTFLDSAQVTFSTSTGNTATAFTGFDCSNSAVTGIFLNNWTGNAWLSPTITRSTNGITLTRNSVNSSGVNGTVTLYLIRY